MSYRGVWVAPWVGPEGELVVYAIQRNRQLATEPLTIPHGANRLAIVDSLYELLDVVDPPADSTLPSKPPRFGLLARRHIRARLLGLKVC